MTPKQVDLLNVGLATTALALTVVGIVKLYPLVRDDNSGKLRLAVGLLVLGSLIGGTAYTTKGVTFGAPAASASA